MSGALSRPNAQHDLAELLDRRADVGGIGLSVLTALEVAAL